MIIVLFSLFCVLLGKETRTIRVDGKEFTTNVPAKITLNALEVHEVQTLNDIRKHVASVRLGKN